MTHHDVHALAPEYVLGTLDAASRDGVLAHLAECPACRAEVAAVSQVCDAIGRSVTPVDPPAALRDRILAIPGAVAPTTAVPQAPMFSQVRLWQAAAAVLAAVALWQSTASRQEIAELQQRLAHETQVLRAGDLITYSLQAHEPARGAHARAWVSHKDGMVFTAEGLPTLPPGMVYQLWVIVDAEPVSVGTFTPDAAGRVHAVMDTPPIAVMPARVAVTLEPAGGRPAPSGAVYLDGEALDGN